MHDLSKCKPAKKPKMLPVIPAAVAVFKTSICCLAIALICWSAKNTEVRLPNRKAPLHRIVVCSSSVAKQAESLTLTFRDYSKKLTLCFMKPSSSHRRLDSQNTSSLTGSSLIPSVNTATSPFYKSAFDIQVKENGARHMQDTFAA